MDSVGITELEPELNVIRRMGLRLPHGDDDVFIIVVEKLWGYWLPRERAWAVFQEDRHTSEPLRQCPPSKLWLVYPEYIDFVTIIPQSPGGTA